MDLLSIILALVASAFFSGSEIAFVVANRLRTEVVARRRGMVGGVVRSFLQQPSSFLTTTLVGNNVAMVVYSTLMAFYLAPPLNAFFGGVLRMDAGLEVAVLGTQTFVAALVVLIVGEIVPKTLMRETANQAVFALALPLRATYYLLLPLVKIAGGTAELLVRLFRADAETFAQFMRHDFEIVIQESRESGELDLDDGETALLSNALALASIRVKESMVPRTDVEAVDEHIPLDVLRRRFMETGHSKLPVYRDNIDHIIGVVFAYDLFLEPAHSVDALIRPVQYVPEAKRSRDLLRSFLASGTSIAVVIDEYGGTAGIVTREDLLEELFGDIQDEFDVDKEVLHESTPGRYVVSGRVALDDLADRFDVVLPPGDYETVAGYLIDRLGSIPAPRDEFLLDGFRFIILKATPNRVDLVRLVRHRRPTAEQEAGEEAE